MAITLLLLTDYLWVLLTKTLAAYPYLLVIHTYIYTPIPASLPLENRYQVRMSHSMVPMKAGAPFHSSAFPSAFPSLLHPFCLFSLLPTSSLSLSYLSIHYYSPPSSHLPCWRVESPWGGSCSPCSHAGGPMPCWLCWKHRSLPSYAGGLQFACGNSSTSAGAFTTMNTLHY